jgi:hypothetical protein
MPLKNKRPVHTKKHPRHYLKVYAPYLPLLLVVGFGCLVLGRTDIKPTNKVLGYATNIQAQALLDETNQERTSRGLPILKLNSELASAAQTKGQDMAARNYWSHDTPDGKEPWYFVKQSGYDYYKAAENLAYGFKTSDATINGWMNSPAHRANVLDPALTEVGFGIVNAANYQNSGPETIVVAMYGEPTSNVVAAASGTAPAQTLASQSQQKVSYMQSLTNGRTPWSTFVAGLLIGAIGLYLITSHTLRLRRALRQSERFVVKHPLLDVTLIALIALVTLLSQTDGIIH